MKKRLHEEEGTKVPKSQGVKNLRDMLQSSEDPNSSGQVTGDGPDFQCLEQRRKFWNWHTLVQKGLRNYLHHSCGLKYHHNLNYRSCGGPQRLIRKHLRVKAEHRKAVTPISSDRDDSSVVYKYAT
ncbi:hypothetical protein MUG91_G76n8 [Manis pentadactyla]|nr:hypothetical protein MUG91_G76n8 [Manis pentadactyla]